MRFDMPITRRDHDEESRRGRTAAELARPDEWKLISVLNAARQTLRLHYHLMNVRRDLLRVDFMSAGAHQRHILATSNPKFVVIRRRIEYVIASSQDT